MKTEKKNDRPLTFDDAEKMVRAALKGTAYETSEMEKWGGGDGEEDIKPFRFDSVNGTDLGVTVCPDDGYMEFWVWPEDEDMKVFDTAAEAITEFRRLIAA